MARFVGETVVYRDGAMGDAEVRAIAGGSAAVYSARCPGKESANEDAAALIPVGEAAGVLAVADGLGGLPAGERASVLAVRCLASALKRAEPGDATLRSAILDGFEHANRAVAKLGVGAATTLAVAEIQKGSMRPYHVGDSMILVVGQRGKIKLQTVSHSPVGFAVEAGVLDESEAMHHEDRHIVSNVLGAPDMRIEIGSTIAIAPCDTVLLASDGLFDNLHIAEIVQRLRKGPLALGAQRLAADASRRMSDPEDGLPSKPDDLTFVAFRATPGAG